MSVIQSTLKQPLIHFVLIGALLFLIFNLSDQQNEVVDESIITVTRADLLSYMQYQAKARQNE